MERLILHYDSAYSGPPDIDMIRSVCRNSTVYLIDTSEILSFVVIGISSGDVENIHEILHTLPFITDIEYDPLRFACSESNGDSDTVPIITDTRIQTDPLNQFQWSIPAMNVSLIRKPPDTGDIIVSIIDSGIDYRSADIRDRYLPGGFDWYGKDNDPVDRDGHGTHLAGIVSATSNNGIGISGIANVSLMAERIYGETFTAYASDSARAIVHAADSGADIILIGYGGDIESRAESKAIQYATQKGCFIIAPAGNDNSNMPHYPSDLPSVMSVGAYDAKKERSSFSNYGIFLGIMAPGEDILSTHPGDRYVYQSGTSQAAAMTAGVAALLYSLYPDTDADTARTSLIATVRKNGESDRDIFYGYGCIDAYAAYNNLSARMQNITVYAENETSQVNETESKKLPYVIKIPMQKGWNCISFPSSPAGNKTLYNFLSSVDTGGHTIWEYVAEPGNTGWQSLTREYIIEPLKGIFIYSVEPENLTVSLMNDTNVSRNLYQGWNVIGIPGTEPISASEGLYSLGDDWVTLLALNVSSGFYDATVINGGEGLFSDQYQLNPQTGYWIYMRNNDTMTV